MAKLEVFVVLLLPLVVLQLDLHTAPAAAAVTSVVRPIVRRSLVPQQPQQTPGGELAVRVPALAPASGSSSTFYSGNYEKDGQMSPQVPAAPLDPGLCNYEVTTQTGNQWSAGTDSTISLRLANSEQDNIYMVLSEGRIDRGARDTFKTLERCVPHICKMTLYTNSQGWLPCWYAVFVDVIVTPVTAGTPATEASDHQKWRVEEWLPAHEWSSSASLVRNHCPESGSTT